MAGVVTSGLISDVSAQLPAFPGAEGFGAQATGGRGGDVYTVVNLNSSGAGSLRYGIETAPSQGRTIVFAVSGYIPINYNSDTGNQTLRIVQNKITIAGQTAPGDGIGLKDGRILVTGDNSIIRHIRIRHGKYGGAGDCLNIESSASDTMMDHLTLMFSTDENISFFNNAADDFTLQYSTSAWGMERHNAGGLWDLEDGTCHHSLWAHHRTRNPKARPYGLLEWINNVTFHWRSEGFIMGDSTTPADWRANVIGCYYLSISDFDFGLDNTPFSKARIDRNGNPNFSIHLNNCLHDADGDGVLDGTDKGYSIVSGSEFVAGEFVPPSSGEGQNRYVKSATPFPGAPVPVTIDDPLTAYKKVISSAGALRLDANFAGPLRDELDNLLIESIENQESILVAKDTPLNSEHPPSNGEAQLAGPPYNISNNGFGTLNSTTAPTDSDGDGMPDFWELNIGSSHTVQNHNSPVPAGAYIPNAPAGYTLLEEYLHFRAIPHAVIPERTMSEPSSLSVDLRRYTRGFNVAPVDFTLSNFQNGTATMQPDGHTAVFEPTLNFSGRARFDFTVTDGDGSAWTQTLAVLVTMGPPAAPSGLTASPISSGSIVLSWTDNSSNEFGFKIERSTDGVFFSEIDSVNANLTSYTNAVAPETTYHYRVRAHNLEGHSGYSNTDSATTPAGSPAAPASIVATPANSRISLNWDVSPGATSYKVKRSTSSGGAFTTIASVTGIRFEDQYAVNGTTYFYVVSALNSAGESGNSSETSATPSSTVTYPAEDESYGGGAVFEDSNGGFNGTGYVNSSSDGSYLQFDDVDAGGGGSVTLRFRNALGNTARTGRLIINGVTNSISFASTSTWTTWVNKDVVVTLSPGTANYVRLETSGQDLANIDELTVFGTPVSPPPAAPLINESVTVQGGMVMSGFGGLPFDTYHLLSSSNLTAALPDWTRIATNQLDANGVFTVTNGIDASKPELFYRIELP